MLAQQGLVHTVWLRKSGSKLLIVVKRFIIWLATLFFCFDASIARTEFFIYFGHSAFLVVDLVGIWNWYLDVFVHIAFSFLCSFVLTRIRVVGELELILLIKAIAPLRVRKVEITTTTRLDSHGSSTNTVPLVTPVTITIIIVEFRCQDHQWIFEFVIIRGDYHFTSCQVAFLNTDAHFATHHVLRLRLRLLARVHVFFCDLLTHVLSTARMLR